MNRCLQKTHSSCLTSAQANTQPQSRLMVVMTSLQLKMFSQPTLLKSSI